jgi:SAM-dependent methyltransferase
VLRTALRTIEYFFFGTAIRERGLIALLRLYYDSKFRRNWYWAAEPPHFSDSRFGAFRFAFSHERGGANNYFRAFLSSEVIREGDRLLDIGCGDGFLTKRFFAEQCAHIDAIDIEPDAIRVANACNAAPNIKFHLADAVAQPFPSEKYNVIVWDGAIGHFPPETTTRFLEKISKSLLDEGVFVGSESLGHDEGRDHLQFFESLQDLYRLFRPHFEFVALRSIAYEVGIGQKFTRREAYWRCANNPTRVMRTQWLRFENGSDSGLT